MDAIDLNPHPQKMIVPKTKSYSPRCMALSFVLANIIVFALFSTQMFVHITPFYERTLFGVMLCAMALGVAIGRHASAQPQIHAHKWIILTILAIGIGLHPLSFNLVHRIHHKLFAAQHSTTMMMIWIGCFVPPVMAVVTTLVYHHRWHTEPIRVLPSTLWCIAVFVSTWFFCFSHMGHTIHSLLGWYLPGLACLTLISLVSFLDLHTLKASQWLQLIIAMFFVSIFNISLHRLIL